MTTLNPTRLLRWSLQGNAWFSGLSGLLFLRGAESIAMFLGISAFWIIRALGLGLILYALWLLMTVRRPTLNRREVMTTIGLDTAWVFCSALRLIANPLSLSIAGKWAVVIVADIVAIFAALQFYGLHVQQTGTIPHEAR